MTDLKDIIDEYFELGSYKSCLDGWFTSEELRLITDEMDRLAKKEKKEELE